MIDDPKFYAIAIPAVLILGLSKSGFLTGFGSMVTPMLALTMPAPQAAAILLPLLAVADVTGVQRLWRECDRDLLRSLLPAALVGIGLGTLAFGLMSPQAVAGVLGVMTLAFLALRRLRPSYAPAPRSAWRARVLAATSGFTTFVGNAGIPPVMAYVLPLKLPPITVTATMAVYFAALNLTKWVPYAALGLFNWQVVSTALVLIPLAPVGVWLGVWLTRRVDPKLFYLVADVGMLITGLVLIRSAWP